MKNLFLIVSMIGLFFICQTNSTFAVGPIGFNVTVTDISSPGANDGQLVITGLTAGSPYTYSIDNGGTYQPGSTFTNLAPGDYLVRVKDFTGRESWDANLLNIYWSTDYFTRELHRSVSDAGSSNLLSTMSSEIRKILVDEENGKIYFVMDYTNGIYSLDTNGINLDTLYQSTEYINRCDEFTIDPLNNKLYYILRNGMLYETNLDGTGSPVLIAGGDVLESIADMDLDIDKGVLYMLGWDGFLYSVKTDGTELKTITNINQDRTSYGYLHSLTLNTTDEVIYLAYADTIASVKYGGADYTEWSTSGGRIRDLAYEAGTRKVYFTCDANEVRSINNDGTGEVVLFSASRATNIDHGKANIYRVCGVAPDMPTLSVNMSNPICQGTNTTISIAPTDQLNDASYWAIYSGSCGETFVDSNTSGTFVVSPTLLTTFYVRGEGACSGPGVCASVTVGDDVPPIINTCNNITLNLVNNSASISVSDLFSGASITPVVSLSDVLTSFNANASTLAGFVPNKFSIRLDRGASGVKYIADGGSDMYDGGNMLNTNLKNRLSYTGGVISAEAGFGSGGQYFTRYQSGMFFMAADMDGVDSFYISGELGADGDGSVKGLNLSTTYNGVSYYAFIKRVDDGDMGSDDPTVNHMIVVPDNPSVLHYYSVDTDDDFDLVNNLSGSARIYYLLYASRGGSHVISDEEATEIFHRFVENILYPLSIPDNCGLAYMSLSDYNFSCVDLGVNTVSVNATDMAGNVSSCSSTVTVIDTEAPVITCPADKVVMADAGQCGAVVDYSTVVSVPVQQWASSVIGFSSEYGGGYGAAEVLQAPDVYPDYGDIEGAWTPSNYDSPREYLALGFTYPTHVLQVNVFETYNPGAIDTVSLRDASTGTWHKVWSGPADPNLPEQARVFSVAIPLTPYLVDGVRLDLDNDIISDYNEIDAVQIVGTGLISITNTVSDNCLSNPEATQTSGMPSGSFFPLGTTTNTFSITDNSGNTATCNCKVTVLDSTVSGLYTSDVTLTSARLNWTPLPGALGYHIRGKVLNSPIFVNITVPGGSSSYKDVFGLTYNRTYAWQIRSICQGGDTTSWSAPDTFSTACAVPDSFWTSNVTGSSARFNWVKVKGVDGYEVRGRINNGTPGPWVKLPVAGANTTFKNVLGLIPNNTYEWKVKAICNSALSIGSDNTETLIFTTLNTRMSDGPGNYDHETTLRVSPNPFNFSTKIEFDNPDLEEYVLVLQDVSGRTIRKQEGIRTDRYILYKDALSSGIYFITLYGPRTYRTRVMVE